MLATEHLAVKPTSSGFEVFNTKKESCYQLQWIGDGQLMCQCKASQFGRHCSHIEAALAYADASAEPIEIKSAAIEVAPKHVAATIHNPTEILPGIYATAQQERAIESLIEFSNGNSLVFGLFGFAGTGKTTVLQGWVKRLRENGSRLSICFTAPTNKATQVLFNMVSQWGLDIECVTCAKLLGLKPVIDFKTGKEEFKKSYGEDSQAQEYDIIVVDECSMVNSSLWEYLVEESNMFTRLLFVGDYAQLPPVKEDISRSFLEIEQFCQLTEVKRYRGAIAAIADDIRGNLSRRSDPTITTEYTEDGSEGVFVLGNGSWREAITKGFTSMNYRLNAEHCRVLTWTNDSVNSYNRLIRGVLYGKNAPRFIEGERIVANSHYAIEALLGGRTTLFPTSTEMEVSECWEGTQGGWAVWTIKAKILDAEHRTVCFPVLHEREAKRFDAHLKQIKNAAKANSSRWKDYYEQRGLFADVSYAYASTVHKAQGSTYINTFVDIPNILKNRGQLKTIQFPHGKEQIYERNQLLYTALTRSSARLFVPEF